MVHECLAAATQLSREHGIEAEVIDLRCVRPLDEDTVLASVARTGRIVVATEDWPWGSVASEVLAVVTSRAFHMLDAPPARLAALDVPIPSHPDLYHAQRPNAAAIVEQVLDTVSY